jgi:hypothetical protein
MRAMLLLLGVQVAGTLMPLVLLPSEVFIRIPFAPTLEGQYIIKPHRVPPGTTRVFARLAREKCHRGFNSKQFNSNVVVRWEYRPASTLFVVWQQGRAQEDRHLGTCETRRDLNDLFDTLSSNTVLVKLSYWFNP